MDAMTLQKPAAKPGKKARAAGRTPTRLAEHIIEIISDSGEGAQKCGQSLGSIAAQMGNGIWTTEIIPAEIRPPARSVAGASGNRIRIGSERITNGGDKTDLVVAFNEQVLLGRVRAGELKPGAIILLESMWRSNADAAIVASYAETHQRLLAAGYQVYEIPMEQECKAILADAKRGKNMFALGMLCQLYSLDLKLATEQIFLTFGKKDQSVIDSNVRLLEAGHRWAAENLDFCYAIPATRPATPQIVVNGNTALALGTLASAWRSAPCTRSPRPPRPRTTWPTCSRRSAGWCTRPRTRSRRAPSPSAPRMPASAPSRSPRAPAIRSSRKPSGWP
jgi:2-oxoglutarate ferredoxin oxidoreductase subunit alpha